MAHSTLSLFDIDHGKMLITSSRNSLFSFAKFLELLVYSPNICTITPSMCEHTTPSSQVSSTGALPSSRFNIVRNFTYRRGNDKCVTVSFSISEIEDIFELRVPRLQITRRANGDKSAQNSIKNEDGYGSEDANSAAEEEKKVLRREIKAWWQGISDHMDKLVSLNAANLLFCLMSIIFIGRNIDWRRSGCFTQVLASITIRR